MKFSFAGLSLALALSPSGMPIVSGQSEIPPVLQIHGSGTTNPSKCYWHIMDQMEEQMRLPAKLSYRAVGSGTGQTEFIGSTNMPDNDFGSGDIPLATGQYDSLMNAGIEIVHLPIVLGAISFFHSVPVEKLNVSPCLMAKLLDGKIENWNDQAVIDENPEIEAALPDGSLPVNIARRGDASSSTSSITNFLNTACPELWPNSKVGKRPDEVSWPDSAQVCLGSSGMTKCIRDMPGTIGYIDAGHGQSEGLSEIELENADGTFLTSAIAKENGGIQAAVNATDANLPDNLDENFGNVQLLNKPGEYTWPIVALSYIYVRKDLPSFIPNPINQELLKAFLNALYIDEYIKDCDENFNFTPVPEDLRKKAQDAIKEMLVSDALPEETFVFESEDDKDMGRVGQGEFIVSAKRDTYAAVEQRQIAASVKGLVASGDGDSSSIVGDVEALETEVTAIRGELNDVKTAVSSGVDIEGSNTLQAQIDALRSELDALKTTVTNGGGADGSTSGFQSTADHDHDDNEFTDDDKTMLEAALALSIIAFVLWAVAIILGLAKMCGLF